MHVGLVLLFASLFMVGSTALVRRTGRPLAATDAELEAAYRAFMSTTRFSALDGLRAISVLAVIWYHVGGTHGLNLLNQGNRGVDVFFAISGFLVTNLLLRERRRDGAISLWNFFIRRTLRIFPLHYAVLSMYGVLVFLTLRGTPKAAQFWQDFPAFASYTSNWFVGPDDGGDHGVAFDFAWSLATEAQFYLFWPPLLALLLWWKGKPWIAAAAAGVLVVLHAAAVRAGAGLAATVVGSFAPAILFGAVFALLLDSRATFRIVYPSLGHRFAPPIALVLVLACLQVGAPGLLTQFLVAVFVVTLCVREGTHWHRVLASGPLAFVGSISYGISLMHMLAADMARKSAGHQDGLDVFLLTLLVVVAMAYVSFRFFEEPLLRRKDRFRGKPEATIAPLGSTPGAA